MAVSSTDQLPIYRDNLDKPMAFGRLYYYSVGTSTLKAVYTDRFFTIPATNPQLLNADGRTSNQIFLDSGTYTVKAYAFFGTDPYTDGDFAWVFNHEWIEEGTLSSSIVSGYLPVTSNIADLRTVDPSASSDRTVIGYYTAGDLFPRNYHWNPTSLALDNGGTVIRNNVLSLGAWELVIGNTDVIDVRIFGAIPNRAGSYNSQIASCMTATASSNQPRTMYFPAGIYEVSAGTQSFSCHTIYDAGCQFKNLSVADFNLQHIYTFDIKGVNAFKAVTSTGNVVLQCQYLSGLEEVDPRWYGAILDGTTDDAVAFRATLSNILPHYPVKLVGVVRLYTALTVALNIKNPIHTYNMGGFKSDQVAHTIQFSAPGYIRANNRRYEDQVYPVIYPTNRTMFFFTGYSEVRASWFANPVDGNAYAQNVDEIIKNSNNTIPEGGTFVIDYDSTFSTAGMSTLQSSNWNIRHEKGTCSTQGTNYIYFKSLDASPNSVVFENGYFCVGGQTYAKWWTLFDRSVISAFASGSTLDLNGDAYNIGATIPVTTIRSQNITKICNGFINTTAQVTMINCTATVYSFEAADLTISDSAYGSTFFAMDGASAYKFKFLSSYFGSTNTTTASVVRMPNSGVITFITFEDCFITTKYLINETSQKSIYVNLNNNKRLKGDLYFKGEYFNVNNSNIIGSTTGVWDVSSVKPANINNNVVEACDIFAGSSVVGTENLIQHIIQGNNFIQSNAKWSRVMYKARHTGTKMFGAIAHGNSCTGITTTGSGLLFNVATDGGTWNAGGHYFSITDNSGGTANIVVNRTEGIALLTFPKSAIPVGKRSVGDVFMVDVAPSADMIYIPGATTHGIYVGNFHYFYNNVAFSYPISEYLSYLGCNATSATSLNVVGRCLETIGGVDGDLGAVQLYFKLYA